MCFVAAAVLKECVSSLEFNTASTYLKSMMPLHCPQITAHHRI